MWQGAPAAPHNWQARAAWGGGGGCGGDSDGSGGGGGGPAGRVGRSTGDSVQKFPPINHHRLTAG